MGCVGSRHRRDLQVTHRFPLDVESYTCQNLYNWRWKASFKLSDNMNGDVLAVGSEILPELNKILHKYTFSPCCIFIIAALLSFLICLIETAITISLHILGEDVPELQTGIEDNYPGSISPYAPQDGSFVILAQDAELNDDRKIFLLTFGLCNFAFCTFVFWTFLIICNINFCKYQLNECVKRWNRWQWWHL